MKKEYFNNCFFCSNPSISNKNEHKIKVGDMVVANFFNLIKKYFVTGGGPTNMSNNKHNQFAIKKLLEKSVVCMECGIILKSVSQLYQQLECLKMKINNKIGQLRENMDTATNITQAESQEEFEQLRKLKKMFSDKCSDHLHKMQPTVTLIRCNKRECKQYQSNDDDDQSDNHDHSDCGIGSPNVAVRVENGEPTFHQFGNFKDENMEPDADPGTHGIPCGDDNGTCDDAQHSCFANPVEEASTSQVIEIKDPNCSATVLTSNVTSGLEAQPSSKGRLRRKFECGQCRKIFTKLTRLEAHVKSHDHDDQMESCNEEMFENLHGDDEMKKDIRDDIRSATGNGSTGGDLDRTKMVACQPEEFQETEMSSRKKGKLKKGRNKVKVDTSSKNKKVYWFKCTLCPATFHNPFAIRVHIRKMHCGLDAKKMPETHFVITKDNITAKQWALKTGAKFECPVEACGKMFMTETCLNDHSKLHGEFPCKFCDDVKHFAKDLALHELEEHSHAGEDNYNEEAKKGSCPRCPFQIPKFFTAQTNMAIYVNHHLHVHLNLLVDGVRCPVCKNIFLSSDKRTRMRNLVNHFLTHHQVPVDTLTDNMHRCPEPGCDAYFHTASQLEDHNSVFHVTGSYKYVCTDCGSKFREKMYLNSHREKKHWEIWSNLSKFSCKEPGCGKRWESQLDLDRHMSLRHSGKPDSTFLCTHCGKGFRCESFLMQHMKVHNTTLQRERELAKPVCDQCGKRFNKKDRLERHLQSHSGPSSWKFSCQVCNKKCIDKPKLAEHMRTHSKARPFICQICGETYAHTHNLRSHMERVHGDKKPEPFLCKECGAQYAFKHNLRNHIKAKHSVNDHLATN